MTESRSRHGDMSLEHNCRVVLLMPVMLLMSNNNCRVLFLVTIKHNNNDCNYNNSEVQSGTSDVTYSALMTTSVLDAITSLTLIPINSNDLSITLKFQKPSLLSLYISKPLFHRCYNHTTLDFKPGWTLVSPTCLVHLHKCTD